MMRSLITTDWKKYMSNDEDFLRRIQDQFDKIVDSEPHKSITPEEKERRRLIQERKDLVKKELDEHAQGTVPNEIIE